MADTETNPSNIAAMTWAQPPQPVAARPVIAVAREHIINRQGKDFVLYAGLLHAATAAGLYETQTNLVQAPGPSNGNTAICHARVVFPWGSFEGIGDANEGNVGRMIAAHIIRMAETRAKARAFRDALDVGMVAVEELTSLPRESNGGDDEDDEPPARPAARRPVQAPNREEQARPTTDYSRNTQPAGPASLEAEVEKYGKIMVTASRLKAQGNLKVTEKDWSVLSAPFAPDADAAYVAGQYQKVLALINAAVAKR